MTKPAKNRERTRGMMLDRLRAGGSRCDAVRAALDAGCPWDTIDRVLYRLEKSGACERRRVMPAKRPTTGTEKEAQDETQPAT